MGQQHLIFFSLAKHVRAFKRRVADFVNELLRRRSKRTQRGILLTIGILLSAACACQVLYSLGDRGKLRRVGHISVPADILGDTTDFKHTPRVIGILVPHNPLSADSLWISASIHKRYFMGNRIRWLEISLDTLKVFRQTHYYKPIR